MSADRIERLEERLAWLERHVVAQDKAMLEMAQRLDRLEAEQRQARERAAGEQPLPGPADERPPHY